MKHIKLFEKVKFTNQKGYGIGQYLYDRFYPKKYDIDLYEIEELDLSTKELIRYNITFKMKRITGETLPHLNNIINYIKNFNVQDRLITFETGYETSKIYFKIVINNYDKLLLLKKEAEMNANANKYSI